MPSAAEHFNTEVLLPSSPCSQVHGANPGLVSHFVKQALLNIATDVGVTTASDYVEPTTQLQWAALAQKLGVQVIHVSERDTQVTATPKRRGEFVNTYVRCRGSPSCYLVFKSRDRGSVHQSRQRPIAP